MTIEDKNKTDGRVSAIFTTLMLNLIEGIKRYNYDGCKPPDREALELIWYVSKIESELDEAREELKILRDRCKRDELESENASLRGDQPIPAWVTDYPPTPGYNWLCRDRSGIWKAIKKPEWDNGAWHPALYSTMERIKDGCSCSPGGPDCLAELVESEGRWYMRGGQS